jgi:hypothetical protein
MRRQKRNEAVDAVVRARIMALDKDIAMEEELNAEKRMILEQREKEQKALIAERASLLAFLPSEFEEKGDGPSPSNETMVNYLTNRLEAIFRSAPIGDPRSYDTPEVALVHLTRVEQQ